MATSNIAATNDFLNKLFMLFEEDGMMRCFYKLFKNQIEIFSPSELFLLSLIQDEYQKLYEQYYVKNCVTGTETLDRMLSDKYVVEMEESSQTDSLIVTYLHFIRADRQYFTKDFSGAIKNYKEACSRIKNDNCEKSFSDIDKERCAYLINSIALSYMKRDHEKGYAKAIKLYKGMFIEFPDVDQYFFAWRYRRNYGVCLENTNKYLDAIEQYEKAIDMPHKNNEYKLYLTYCSAIMKYWDRETGKLTGEWINNTKQLYKKSPYFSPESIAKIKKSLNLANKHMRSKDLSSMLPDYYNQSTKLLTYRIILSIRKTDRNRYINEVKKNLKILETVSANALGRHYIARDFYYAMSKISSDQTEMKEYFQMAWNENEIIDGKGDAKQFEKLLSYKS